MSKVSDPQYWRRRAEEVRTLADELTDPEAKRKMLKIAEDYETQARRPKQRLRHHSSATIRNWRR
jgi:pyruvate-formate lyase